MATIFGQILGSELFQTQRRRHWSAIWGVSTENRRTIACNGRSGVIVWCDCTDPDRGPYYVVELDSPVSSDGKVWWYLTCLPSEIEFLGSRSCEENHIGHRNEVSFDTVGGQEGCFRTPNNFWEAYFIQEDDVEVASVVRQRWQSGIMGNHFAVPRNTEVTQEFALALLHDLVDANAWSIVSGPDSLLLK